jgi:molybdenum cofactor biosynthesis enzyme MoaA
MSTYIYHITYYEHDKSAYVQFTGCNFRCIGCIRKGFTWDHHLREDSDVEGIMNKKTKTLSLEEFKNIIESVERVAGLKRVILGGGEPTVDPAFRNIVRVLSDVGLEVALLTNGFLLDKVLNCMSRDSIIELSVKSIHREKFSIYTGRSKSDLDVVLKNMKSAFQSGFKIIIETILIPDFNGPEDIELLAAHVASGLSKDVPMIIDEYVPVPSAPWRRPTLKELLEAKERSKKYLREVVVRSSYTGNRLGKIRLVYPKALE